MVNMRESAKNINKVPKISAYLSLNPKSTVNFRNDTFSSYHSVGLQITISHAEFFQFVQFVKVSVVGPPPHLSGAVHLWSDISGKFE